MILFKCPNCGEMDASPRADVTVRLSTSIRGIESRKHRKPVRLGIAQPSIRRPPTWDNLELKEIYCTHCGHKSPQDTWTMLLVCNYCGAVIPDGLEHLEDYWCPLEEATRCTKCWSNIRSRYCEGCSLACTIKGRQT